MAVVEEDIGQDWVGLWNHTAYGSHSGWIIALLVATTLICGLSAAACVCGCRKTRKKHNGGEELHGPKGMIIKTNPDESQGCANHLERLPPINDSAVVNIYPEDTATHETRPLNTAKRSLPDIPIDQMKDGILGDGCKIGSRSVPREMDSLDSNQIKCNDPEMGESAGGTHSGGDTSSDLYATVEDTARDGMSALASMSFGGSGKKRMAPIVPPLTRQLSNSGHETGNLINKEVSMKGPEDDEEEYEDDDSHSRYSRLNKEHPYDSLKTTEEHPYAQVKTSKSDHGRGLYYNEVNASHSSFAPSSSSSRTDGIEGPLQNPIPPPRAHRRSQSGTNGSCASSPPSVHIPAAKAISGGISANQELPYMTPPINLENSNPSTSALTATVSSSLASRGLANSSTPGLETGPGPFQQRGSRGNFHNLESQDSNSYTSISVREPIATIKAQTTEQQKNARLPPLRIPSKNLRSADPHYASVSDDSDEMYAAIGDRSGSSQAIYGSGSETYAQIQPQPIPSAVPSLSSVHRGEVSPLPGLPSPLPPASSPSPHILLPPSISPISTSPISPNSLPPGNTLAAQLQPSPPPQPPSVDSLRQVAQVHSRQASSSSATSSTVNLGSPKPEKRQANSPLPPPPLVPTLAVPEVDDEDDIRVVEQPEVELRHDKLPHTPQNLEEMYAKVIKKNKRKSEGSALQSLPVSVTSNADSTRKSVGSLSSSLITAAINEAGAPSGRWSETEEHKLSAVTASSRRKSSEGSSMTTSDPDLSLDVRLSLALGEEAESEGEWGVDGEFRHSDVSSAVPDSSGHRSRGMVGPGKPMVGPQAARVEEGDGSGYESVGSRNGEMVSCHGSLLRKAGEDDAGYEELKPRHSASSRGDPGYERVRREGQPCVDDDEDDEEEREGEPRYERVPARGRGAIPGYETVRERTVATGEPDYERMKGEEEEPNYESVGYSGSLNSGHMSNGPVGDSLHNDYESLAGVSNGDEVMYDGRTSNSPITPPYAAAVDQSSQLDAMYAKVHKGKKNS